MPNIKAKSDENFSAANLLVSSDMHDASVHCAYYSCFQLMKYAIKSEGIDYENQKKNYTLYVHEMHDGESRKLGSHEYLIQQFIVESAKKDMRSTIAINRNISHLKAFRTKADYDDIRVNESESKVCSEMAEETRELIIKTYGL